MDIMTNFFNWLNDDASVAMEAEDITGDAIKGASKVVGGDAAGNQDNNGDINLNTNDILGTQEPNNQSEGGDNTSTDDTQDSGADGENPDDMGDDMDEEDPNTMQDNEMSGDEPKEEEDPFAEDRKKKLKKQFIYLYDVVNDSAKLISGYAPNVTNNETIKVLNSINNNLIQCKDKIFTLLTEDYPTMKYHELLKNYIALNRVYDLTSKSLELYFEKYNADEEKMKKKKFEE